MKSRCPPPTVLRRTTRWGFSWNSSFIELVFELFGQRVVEIIGNRELSLRRTEVALLRASFYWHEFGHRLACPGDDNFSPAADGSNRRERRVLASWMLTSIVCFRPGLGLSQLRAQFLSAGGAGFGVFFCSSSLAIFSARSVIFSMDCCMRGITACMDSVMMVGISRNSF